MSFDGSALANVPTRKLRAYDPGHDLPALRRRFAAELAELGSNENPLGPAPGAMAAVRKALAQTHRYPDPRVGELRAALAQSHAVPADTIVFGNGSHELLMLLAQCFAGPGQAVMYSQYGFAVFAIAAAAAGADTVCVPALPREHVHAPLGHDLVAMRAAMRADVRLVYLANPNNPTGSWFGLDELMRFLDAVSQDTLVVVDEAYAEYFEHEGGESAMSLMSAYPNLIVTRTFSKAHALAGLRIGYLLAHASVTAVLERLRESFNVNLVAQVAALASLEDTAHLTRVLQHNLKERAWLAAELASRGLRCLPSRGNFLLLDAGPAANDTERRLYARGVIVRPMAGYGLPEFLRISVGLRAENQRLLAALP